MSKMPHKENNINHYILIIFFLNLPKFEEGIRRANNAELTESHPNNTFVYKDAHTLTFFTPNNIFCYVYQHVCQHSRMSEGVFTNFRLSQVLVLKSTLYNFF